MTVLPTNVMFVAFKPLQFFLYAREIIAYPFALKLSSLENILTISIDYDHLHAVSETVSVATVLRTVASYSSFEYKTTLGPRAVLLTSSGLFWIILESPLSKVECMVRHTHSRTNTHLHTYARTHACLLTHTLRTPLHTYAHHNMLALTHTHTHTCMPTRTLAHTHRHVHTRTHSSLTHTDMYTHAHTHSRTRTHTHRHSHMHKHIHTHIIFT